MIKMAGKDKNSNPMREIRVAKLTLNIGTGKDQQLLEKAQKLLKHITGIDSVRTITQKRIAAWGLRPGLPIGCKITMRGEEAEAMILRLIAAVENKLDPSHFDENGNVSFGIKEYIDIKDAKYEPSIGSMGLQCSITLERPGFRIKKRKLLKRTIPMHHRISRADSVAFLDKKFGLKLITKDEDN